MRIGIDFGTCFSSAALMMDGSPKPIKSPDGQGFSLPSSVYVLPSGDILVGWAADRQRARDASRYRREFKRNLGAREPFVLGERTFLPEELVSLVLAKLKGEADRLLREQLTTAVITVPATYSEYKQGLMRQAACEAGFKEVELLEEPIAAAIAYAHHHKGSQEGEVVVVYDLGGGTFDTAVLRKQGGGYEILGMPGGIERCGGTDFDQAIYADLTCRCSPQLRELLDPARQDAIALLARSEVLERCIEIKHQLSGVSEADVPLMVVPGLGSVEHYQLDRQAFQRMIAPYIEETLECCRRVVKSAGLQWSQVDRVLLVGGSCRIPYVREQLKQAFGRPISSSTDLELIVCEGAALFTAQREEREQQPVAAPIPGSDHYISTTEALQHTQPEIPIKVLRNNQPGARNIEKGSFIEREGNIPDSARVLQVLRQFQPQNDFFIYPDIPQDKLANARNKCNIPDDEQVLALVDCTMLGSAKDCILFGTKGIYYHLLLTSHFMIPYSHFSKCVFIHKGRVVIEQGTGQWFRMSMSRFPAQTLCQMLNAIKKLF